MNEKPDDDGQDADELNELLDSKIQLYRELNNLSVSLSDEVFEHMERCPIDGPFLDRRTVAWEKKSDLLDNRLRGVDVAIDELENEIERLEKKLLAVEADSVEDSAIKQGAPNMAANRTR